MTFVIGWIATNEQIHVFKSRGRERERQKVINNSRPWTSMVIINGNKCTHNKKSLSVEVHERMAFIQLAIAFIPLTLSLSLSLYVVRQTNDILLRNQIGIKVVSNLLQWLRNMIFFQYVLFYKHDVIYIFLFFSSLSLSLYILSVTFLAWNCTTLYKDWITSFIDVNPYNMSETDTQ